MHERVVHKVQRDHRERHPNGRRLARDASRSADGRPAQLASRGGGSHGLATVAYGAETGNGVRPGLGFGQLRDGNEGALVVVWAAPAVIDAWVERPRTAGPFGVVAIRTPPQPDTGLRGWHRA
ncbi:MAG TPA: hypothetical protein VI006_05185 [Solirubrobacteraceae bacterium]